MQKSIWRIASKAVPVRGSASCTIERAAEKVSVYVPGMAQMFTTSAGIFEVSGVVG